MRSMGTVFRSFLAFKFFSTQPTTSPSNRNEPGRKWRGIESLEPRTLLTTTDFDLARDFSELQSGQWGVYAGSQQLDHFADWENTGQAAWAPAAVGNSAYPDIFTMSAFGPVGA